MTGDGSSSHRPAKKRKFDSGTNMVSGLASKLFDSLLISIWADSSADGRSVAAEGQVRDQPSIPPMPVAHANFFRKLPQELKDQIHEYVLLDKVGADGEVEIMAYNEHGIVRTEGSLYAFTLVFKAPEYRQEFEAAATAVQKFVRGHRKFKATCYSFESRNVSMVWIQYALLKSLLGPSPPFQNSFCLTVKTWGQSDRDTTLDVVAQFFLKELRLWHRSEMPRGTMLLRRWELPGSRDVSACSDQSKSHCLLGEMQNTPLLPPSRDGEDNKAVYSKLWRVITSTGVSVHEVRKLQRALFECFAESIKQA